MKDSNQTTDYSLKNLKDALEEENKNLIDVINKPVGPFDNLALIGPTKVDFSMLLVD